MITLDHLTKIFETPSGNITAASGISMEVNPGEIVVLLGPSGCGKTTTLKMVNGLIPKTSGRVFLNGTDTDTMDAVGLRRSVGYVIQQIGLFPNMTVEGNVCAVPDLLGWDKKKSRARACELLEMVNLDPSFYMERYPRELSGGQQQRVGVIRALAADPPVLLMDEPFGAIDPINREVIQDEFLRMQAEMKKTVMFVSHSIDEAVKMADRVAVFNEGHLVQYDTPDNLLAHPKDDFVASFLGSDRTLKRLTLLSVRDAMIYSEAKVVAEDSLEKAVSVMKEADYRNIVMVGPRGRARAFLNLNDIKGVSGTVGEHSEPLVATTRVDDDLRSAVSTIFRHGVTWLACVDDDGFFKGYLTQRSISATLGSVYIDGNSGGAG